MRELTERFGAWRRTSGAVKRQIPEGGGKQNFFLAAVR